MQPINVGHRGKTNWLWLLIWKRKSNIKSAKARTTAACGALGLMFKTIKTKKYQNNQVNSYSSILKTRNEHKYKPYRLIKVTLSLKNQVL